MGIAELSTGLSQTKVISETSLKMLDKTIDNTKDLAEGQIKMITEASVNGIGTNFDQRV